MIKIPIAICFCLVKQRAFDVCAVERKVKVEVGPVLFNARILQSFVGLFLCTVLHLGLLLPCTLQSSLIFFVRAAAHKSLIKKPFEPYIRCSMGFCTTRLSKTCLVLTLGALKLLGGTT